MIEVVFDPDDIVPPADDIETEPTISMHALTGIQSRVGHTMQVIILINDVRLMTLLDSGSTHNFVDTGAAQRAAIELCGRAGLKVAVANGDRITSSGSYPDL
jgi:predicted aspartyl protease